MKKRISDLFSGLSTALFSIPEGMAYAKLAGVNPVYGLYSGMIPTIAASLTTGSILMISTITSAIAITTQSVLEQASIESHLIPHALFTLTFIIGVVMLVLGLFRLGKIVNFVSNAVITGFVVGAAFLIILGELSELVGIEKHHGIKFLQIIYWIKAFPKWSVTSTLVGLLSLVMVIFFNQSKRYKKFSPLATIFFFTLFTYFFELNILLIKDIAKIPNQLPNISFPDISLIPRLFLGGVSIAFIALTQGAGVSSAIKNPDGTLPDHSKDLVGQGLGNFLGSFFQSMGTGGSLSRTCISIESGATSRFAGVFAGCWLMMIVYFFGSFIEYIPIPVIAGILCVIAGEIIYERYNDIKLIFQTSKASSIVMVSTFITTLFVPLQWTIFIGAFLSYFFYIYTSATKPHLIALQPHIDGSFTRKKVPKKLGKNELLIIDYEGSGFFAQVPKIIELMPSIEEAKHSVIIFRIEHGEEFHSTFLSYLEQFIKDFQRRGNLFLLEGDIPPVMQKILPKENIYPSTSQIFKALHDAIDHANQFLNQKKKSHS